MLLQSLESESTLATESDPIVQSIPSGAAFALDLSELSSFLLSRALSLTGRRELAEDLVQETMANAWQARASFTPGTNLKAWLCKILRNEFYSHQRRAWRQAPWSTVFEETIPSPPGEQMSAIDLCEAACAMNSLPDPQREALILVGVCGFSYEETALLLDATLGTVKSRVARARISLLNALQSRRMRRTKLHPATGTAFNEWLIQLDQLRLSACRILESAGTGAPQTLATVPKIPLRANSAAAASPRTLTCDDDAYAALGSPAAAVSVRDRLADLSSLAATLIAPEFVTAT